jgi:hypothetical protein
MMADVAGLRGAANMGTMMHNMGASSLALALAAGEWMMDVVICVWGLTCVEGVR